MNRHKKELIRAGFKRIINPVMIFHAKRSMGLGKKDKIVCLVRKNSYNNNYIHVALYTDSSCAAGDFKIAYTANQDPVVYGLKRMYMHEVTGDKTKFVLNLVLNSIMFAPTVMKKRFDDNCIKPRVRAVSVWLQHLFGLKIK